MNSGWITVHRKMLESPIFRDSHAVHLWMYLLLKANHKPGKHLVGNSMINIDRGQLLTGRKSLSEATGINESKITRLLKLFESEQQIEQQTFTKYRLISITKYNEHQDVEQQKNSKRTASEQQVNTNNNDNNGNKKDIKEKINFDSWPSLPSEDLMQDWLKMRKRVKASLSQSAMNTIGKQLHIAVNAGFTVEQCISEAETRSWKGFKAEWMKNETNSGNTKPGASRAERVNEALDEIAREDIEQNGFAETLGNRNI